MYYSLYMYTNIFLLKNYKRIKKLSFFIHDKPKEKKLTCIYIYASCKPVSCTEKQIKMRYKEIKLKNFINKVPIHHLKM